MKRARSRRVASFVMGLAHSNVGTENTWGNDLKTWILGVYKNTYPCGAESERRNGGAGVGRPLTTLQPRVGRASCSDDSIMSGMKIYITLQNEYEPTHQKVHHEISSLCFIDPPHHYYHCDHIPHGRHASRVPTHHAVNTSSQTS